jgi:hypothetical protein
MNVIFIAGQNNKRFILKPLYMIAFENYYPEKLIAVSKL